MQLNHRTFYYCYSAITDWYLFGSQTINIFLINFLFDFLLGSLKGINMNVELKPSRRHFCYVVISCSRIACLSKKLKHNNNWKYCEFCAFCVKLRFVSWKQREPRFLCSWGTDGTHDNCKNLICKLDIVLGRYSFSNFSNLRWTMKNKKFDGIRCTSNGIICCYCIKTKSHIIQYLGWRKVILKNSFWTYTAVFWVVSVIVITRS